MRFRYQGLDGFHPNIHEAIAANPAVLAGFVIAELDYHVTSLDDAIKLNQFEDEDLKDYLAWLKAQGVAGEFPSQLLLADTLIRRKDWAKRYIDPEAVAQTIANLPEPMLTEYHPVIEVWSPSRNAGVPVDQVALITDIGGVEHTNRSYRMYPLVQRLTLEEVVVVNALLAAVAPELAIERTGYCLFGVTPPKDILTLTRLLFDRGTPLEVAYLPDRLEVFHKTITTEPERIARAHVAKAFPTVVKPNPFPDGLLPDGAPTAFDLPTGQAFDAATGVMSLLAKLTSPDAEPTMDDAKAFEKAVETLVGKPGSEG